MQIEKVKIKQFYEAEGARGDHQKNMYCQPMGKPWSKKRFKQITTLIRKYSFLKKFLEIGCAEGLYCDYAKSIGAKVVVGMDISSNKIKRCNKDKGVFFSGDWDTFPFPDRQFDVCLLSECIEHALKPKELIDNALKCSEVLILSIPLEKQLQPDPFVDKGNGHIHLFTVDSFKKDYLKDCYIMEDGTDGVYYYAVVSKPEIYDENYLASRL